MSQTILDADEILTRTPLVQLHAHEIALKEARADGAPGAQAWG
jgi:hypothetical protein